MENILDPSYGRITFSRYEWGTDENGVYFWGFEEMPSHTCTKEELGIEGDNSSFMPLPENSMTYVRLYQKKLKCLDPKDMKVSGDYDSDKAQLINMRLQRCEETDTQKCKSPEEITQFFRNKFLFLLYNERYFDSSQYKENSIVDKGRTSWLQVNT